jgi:hypothetical protein
VERIFLIGAAGPLPSLLDAAAGAGIVRLPLATVPPWLAGPGAVLRSPWWSAATTPPCPPDVIAAMLKSRWTRPSGCRYGDFRRACR